MDKISIIDNFITEKECKQLIKLHKKHEKNMWQHEDTFCVSLDNLKEPVVLALRKKMNVLSKEINNSKVNYSNLVKWPEGARHRMHTDYAVRETTLASIVYLNHDYQGGQTHFEDETSIQPVTGRILLFNGNERYHGVKQITEGTRYTVASWYTKI